MRRTHLTFTLIFALSFCLSVWIFQSSIPIVNAAPLVDYHPSINVDGNTELDSFATSFSNETSGNATHPHIIENIEIMSDGPQNGIKIANTDRYLIIRNVNVTEFDQSTNSRGLYLLNCSHITIEDSHFYNNSIGVVLENTNNTEFLDSSGSINKIRGITFENSHNNSLYNVVVFENGLKENEGNGMDLISSNNNTIEYCIFLENWGHGLFLQDSFYNVVFDTAFLYNHGDCFIVTNDPEDTNNFYGNNCKKRVIPGASIGIIAIVALSTVVILVNVTLRHKKKSQSA